MNHKILIVDDEPDAVTFLVTLLEDHDYETCTAFDGNQGLAALRAEKPDLVLLDVKMPNHTGLSLYRALQAEPEYKDTPVIIVSGVAEQAFFGADCRPLPPPAARVDKPISRAELLEAIRRVLDRRNSSEEEQEGESLESSAAPL